MKARFEEEEGVNSKMDGKSRHPFAITCRYCGSNSVRVIAYEYRDLGIFCNSCGKNINCGIYYTDQDDYPDM